MTRQESLSVHAVAIVLVAETTQDLKLTIAMKHGYRGMRDAVKGIGLDSGIVNHVFENDVLANLQLMVETPQAHEIARQTTVAAKAVEVGSVEG